MEKTRPKYRIVSLIGYQAEIKLVPNSLIYNGLIIDETKNTLLVRTSEGVVKRFPKKSIILTILGDEGHEYTVNGKHIIGVLKERTKRSRHKWTKTSIR